MNQPLVTWGVASRPLLGQSTSGDAYLVQAHRDGYLLAVVDGLGHGDAAAFTSGKCVETLKSHADDPVEGLLLRCHERLIATRGAALSLASYDARRRELSWLGVGNIESIYCVAGRLAHVPPRSLVVRNGVVGMRLPPIRVTKITVSPYDTLVLATDGISEGFASSIRGGDSPQTIADDVLSRYGKDTDDALVLVARFGGHA